MKLEKRSFYHLYGFEESLQCGENKESSEVDLYHHVHVVVSEHLAHMRENNEDGGRDEHGEDVSDQRSSKDQDHDKSGLVLSKS